MAFAGLDMPSRGHQSCSYKLLRPHADVTDCGSQMHVCVEARAALLLATQAVPELSGAVTLDILAALGVSPRCVGNVLQSASL
jgi:hypothetical protein